MENIHFMAFAMPAFFLFLYIEYLVAKRKKRQDVFNYESSVSNITIGIAERLLNLFVTGSFYQLYFYVYDNYRLFEIPKTFWVWAILLLATDFVWYWYHRLGHEVNILWAAHIVHHQSEEFNLTVAARITTIQAIVRTGFWCALPFIGFHPAMVISILVVHGVYSFFTHTQMLPRVKWLEYVFVTPSVHGVHHASDEKYLDKNYGDVFTFWDRMFGTYQSEEEKPKYGLTHPLKSYSFLWQHFHYYLEIYELWKRSKGFTDRWLAVFGGPAQMDQDIRPVLEKRFLQDRSGDRCRLKYRNYLYFQIAIAFLLLTLLTYNFVRLENYQLLAGTAFIFLTLINCGALLEQRRWVFYLEYGRLFTITTYLLWHFHYPQYILLPIFGMIAAEKLFHLGKRYNQILLVREA